LTGVRGYSIRNEGNRLIIEKDRKIIGVRSKILPPPSPPGAWGGGGGEKNG